MSSATSSFELMSRINEVLKEFARTLLTEYPIQAILDQLVQQIVYTLPISAAGVTIITPGKAPRYIAASNDMALVYERLQTELGEGPCIQASESGKAVAVPDLRKDSRFPRFAGRALEAGLVAVFTFPLHHQEEALGALDLYRESAGPLNPEELAAAQTLADVAAAYLVNVEMHSELRQMSEMALQASLHDSLTGLANRVLLTERLERALLRAERSGSEVAVMFIDLDNFKSVNDDHDHHIGDEVLMAVAGRLRTCVRSNDTVARLGGDEFVVVCEELDPAAQVAVVSRVTATLGEPYSSSAGDINLRASVGTARAGGHVLAKHVIQAADKAMYMAKSANRAIAFGTDVIDA